MKYVRKVPSDPKRFGVAHVTLIRPSHWWEWFLLPFVGEQWHQTISGLWWRLQREK